MYEPLETSKCEKCGKIIAEPKELIRIKERIEDFSLIYRRTMEIKGAIKLATGT
jgi:hypothetical protein